MKIIAGAIFVLATAILFGAALIAEAVRPLRNDFTCPVVAAGSLLVLIGLGFILAGLVDQRAMPRDLSRTTPAPHSADGGQEGVRKP
jgi:hypothetical protein